MLMHALVCTCTHELLGGSVAFGDANRTKHVCSMCLKSKDSAQAMALAGLIVEVPLF